jgi:hypothetical protein
MDLVDVPDGTLAEAGVQLFDGRIEALDVAHRQLDALLVGQGNEALALFEGGGDGLFDQHVEAGIECLGGHSEVLLRGDGDHHGVHVDLLEKVGETLEGGDAIHRAEVLSDARARVDHAHQVDLLELPRHADMMAAHLSSAHDCQPYDTHVFLLDDAERSAISS